MADLVPGTPYLGDFNCDWCRRRATRLLEPAVKNKDGDLVKRAKVTYTCDGCARRITSVRPAVRAGRRSRTVAGQIDIFEALRS